MRPYDLVMRLGGDEFLCALPSLTLDQARGRFDDLREELKDADDDSVSVGFSELRARDTAEELVKRADADLLSNRLVPARNLEGDPT
jgi:GGDEF domain-containing protein